MKDTNVAARFLCVNTKTFVKKPLAEINCCHNLAIHGTHRHVKKESSYSDIQIGAKLGNSRLAGEGSKQTPNSKPDNNIRLRPS